MIRLSNEYLRDEIEHQLGVRPENGLFLFGIRGAKRVQADAITRTENQPNLYNDVVGIGGPTMLVFTATVDPGAFYTANPLNASGCAHLANGKHRFKKGIHKGHPAIVQDGTFQIWRDKDRDHLQDAHEPTHGESGNGINIHAGGSAIQVGQWSAGCQVIWGGWSGAYWQSFYGTCAGSGLNSFSYYLIDGRKLRV